MFNFLWQVCALQPKWTSPKWILLGQATEFFKQVFTWSSCTIWHFKINSEVFFYLVLTMHIYRLKRQFCLLQHHLFNQNTYCLKQCYKPVSFFFYKEPSPNCMEIYSILILKRLPYIPWVKISPLKIITFYSVFCDVNCSCNPKIHLLHYVKYCIFHWLVFVNHHSLFSSNSLKYLDISFIYRSVYGIYYKNNTCRLLLFTYE